MTTDEWEKKMETLVEEFTTARAIVCRNTVASAPTPDQNRRLRVASFDLANHYVSHAEDT